MRSIRLRWWLVPLALTAGGVCGTVPAGAADRVPTRTVVAEVVALEQCYMLNRLGAAMPDGMIYALRRDVIPVASADSTLKPGAVMLRPDKRPRPLVLRVNEGDCLEIRFTNLIGEAPPSADSSLPSSSLRARISLPARSRIFARS